MEIPLLLQRSNMSTAYYKLNIQSTSRITQWIVLGIVLSALAAAVIGFILIVSVVVSTKNRKLTCNGNGIYYNDERGYCECFECFTGTYCENTVPESKCSIEVGGGNPLMLQQFWMQRADIRRKFSITLDTDYRTSYGAGSLNETLMKTIKKLHDKIGNVETQGKSIVIGTGGLQLIAASMWAMREIAIRNRSADYTMKVFTKAPYFTAYSDWAMMFPTTTEFTSDENLVDQSSIIEYVTLPNNPTGEHREVVYKNSPYTVHDMVFYWPSMTSTPKVNFNVMMFSLSKLTGHGGSRLGWALIKDPEVASLMNFFISRNQYHSSVDTYYRALNLLSFLAQDEEDSLFEYVKNTLAVRWKVLLNLFTKTEQFHVESATGRYYAYIRCSSTIVTSGNSTCTNLFNSVGIISETGDQYGSTKGHYARLDLLMRDYAFDLFVTKVTRLFKTIKE
jgi:aspartate/methionine/tyrosine aminotransferase